MLKVGSVVKLKQRYGSTGIILEIQKAELAGEGGWISMNYVVMTPEGQILNMSSSCIEHIIGESSQ